MESNFHHSVYRGHTHVTVTISNTHLRRTQKDLHVTQTMKSRPSVSQLRLLGNFVGDTRGRASDTTWLTQLLCPSVGIIKYFKKSLNTSKAPPFPIALLTSLEQIPPNYDTLNYLLPSYIYHRHFSQRPDPSGAPRISHERCHQIATTRHCRFCRGNSTRHNVITPNKNCRQWVCKSQEELVDGTRPPWHRNRSTIGSYACPNGIQIRLP